MSGCYKITCILLSLFFSTGLYRPQLVSAGSMPPLQPTRPVPLTLAEPMDEDYTSYLPLVALNMTSQPVPPTIGEVVINEFVANSGEVQVTEWVELFNISSQLLDLSGMWIDDVAGGGGQPRQIPAGTSIQAGGFYTMTFEGFLNDSGDDVRFLSVDQVTVHDSTTYTSASEDFSWCRKPDGGSWSAIECQPTPGSTNTPPLPPGSWTPGTLEIHIFNVGQGASQLIIGPTGRTLLIDVFEASTNTNQGATWIANEIRRITGAEHLDYVMASHWHLDHIGYAGEGGIWSLFEQQGLSVGTLIDRDGGVWEDHNQDGNCDPESEITWHNAGTVTGTATQWICWVTDPGSTGGQVRQLPQIGSTSQIDLGLTEGLTVTIVQADAQGILMLDGITPVAGDHTSESYPPSENDYSITIWLTWGQFDYVSGGDTDGEYASGYDYVYNNVENAVVERIHQPVEVVAVNHHGSSHSSNANYVNILDPVAAIYSVGSTNPYGHPDQVVLDRFFNNGTHQYFTQLGDPARNYYDSVIVDGNVVITVTQGLTYTVAGDPYLAIDPDVVPGDVQESANPAGSQSNLLPASIVLSNLSRSGIFNSLNPAWLPDRTWIETKQRVC